MTVSTQRVFAPKIKISNTALTPLQFNNTKIKLNHDPYAVLGAGRIGANTNNKIAGQISQHQLLSGIDDATRYADAIRQRTGLLYYGLYLAGKESSPPISCDAVNTIQSIFVHADDMKKNMTQYTPEKLAQAWNKMNSLVILLRSQELASK